MVSTVFKEAVEETRDGCAPYGRVVLEEGTIKSALGVFEAGEVTDGRYRQTAGRGRRLPGWYGRLEVVKGAGRGGRGASSGLVGRGVLRTSNLPPVLRSPGFTSRFPWSTGSRGPAVAMGSFEGTRLFRVPVSPR